MIKKYMRRLEYRELTVRLWIDEAPEQTTHEVDEFIQDKLSDGFTRILESGEEIIKDHPEISAIEITYREGNGEVTYREWP